MDQSNADNKLIVRPTQPADLEAIRAMHARAFGPGRFARTAYRLREARGPAEDTLRCGSQTGWIGNTIAAAATMTPIAIGEETQARLLGPVVVAPEFSGHNHGDPLIRAALRAVREAGVQVVILVGDLAYYQRFDFRSVPAGQITLPGPVASNRLLARTWPDEKISSVHGLVAPVSST